jgi:hypothetical protein
MRAVQREHRRARVSEPQEKPEALAAYQDTDVAVQMSASEANRLSLEDLLEILRLSARGLSQRKIADILKCSQPTVCYALQRMAGSADHIRAVAKAKTLNALTKWERAIDVAADRGDHRPAREFVELAHAELRPQQGSSAGGVGVTINIGTAERPISLPDITLSPREISTPGEGE